MRVFVAGYGSAGRRLATICRSLGHDVSAWDQDARRWLQMRADGVRLVEEDVRFADIDAAVIATPAVTHEAIAHALRTVGYAGPLFVEKPIGLDMASRGAQVWRAWPHPTTMVGYNLRWHPDVRATADRLYAPDQVSMRLWCDIRTWPGRSYGPFLHECSHEVDLALWFCRQGGRAVALSGACVSEESAAADLTLTDGSSVEIRALSATYSRQWVVTRGGQVSMMRFASPGGLGQEMYRAEMRHFLAHAQAGTPTECPFAEGVAAVEVCQQALALQAVSW